MLSPVTSLKGIKSLLKGELDERDMKVFYNIRLVGFHSADSGGGLQLAISFVTRQQVRRWETFSSLMFGNLVCLSPRGRFQQAGICLVTWHIWLGMVCIPVCNVVLWRQIH